MAGLIDGWPIIMADTLLLETGAPATFDNGDGFTFSITWGDGIQPGAGLPLRLQLPMDQGMSTIFLTSAFSIGEETTELRWALERLDDTLRRFTFTVLQGTG